MCTYAHRYNEFMANGMAAASRWIMLEIWSESVKLFSYFSAILNQNTSWFWCDTPRPMHITSSCNKTKNETLISALTFMHDSIRSHSLASTFVKLWCLYWWNKCKKCLYFVQFATFATFATVANLIMLMFS